MNDEAKTVPLAPFVVIPLYAKASGLTAKAIRRKIEEGVWLEGREYHRAPDGRLYVSVEGASRWVQGLASKSGRAASASHSRSRASDDAQR